MNNIKEKNFFSVIICCYNSSSFIEETINSVIKQSFDDWEIIIIDDGSTDNTKEKISKYLDTKYDIKYFYQSNAGFAKSRNEAIKKSGGKWIILLDHDDICYENRLQIQYNEINQHNFCDLFFGDALLFGSKNHITKYHLFKEKYNLEIDNIDLSKLVSFEYLIDYGCFIPSSTVAIKKSVIEKFDMFNPKYRYISDYELFCRLSLEINFHASSEKLIIWRIHSQQLSSENSFKENIELMKMFFNFLININSLNLKVKIIRKLLLIFLRILLKK